MTGTGILKNDSPYCVYFLRSQETILKVWTDLFLYGLFTSFFLSYTVVPTRTGSITQGWEFTQLISERIAGFLSKNEQMSDSLIRSFLVSDLSDSLTIAHFL